MPGRETGDKATQTPAKRRGWFTFSRLRMGLVIVLSFAWLWWINQLDHFAFHALAELFSIVVAFAIAVFTWNTRRHLTNGFLLLLGLSYVFVGGLDMLHLLAAGLREPPSLGQIDLTIQLWLAARLLQAGCLLVAATYIGRSLHPLRAVLSLSIIFSVLLLLVLQWHVMPAAFLPGEGLTLFKITTEAVVVVLLLVALGVMWQRRALLDPGIFKLLAAAILVTCASELTFCLYSRVESFPIFIGHYLKILAYYLVYRAIIITGLLAPLRLMFRSVEASERTLQIESARLTALLGQVPAAVLIVDWPSRQVAFSNRLAEEIWGPPDTLAQRCRLPVQEDLHHPDGTPYTSAEWPLNRSLQQGEVVHDEEFDHLAPDGTQRTYVANSTPVYDPAGNIVAGVMMAHDITQRQRDHEALRAAGEELEQRVAERTTQLETAQAVLQGELEKQRQADAALRESELKYRELVENANSIIIRWNSDGTIVFFNEYAQAFFGYTQDQVVGRHINLIIPDTDSEGQDLSDLVQRVAADPEHYKTNENENITRDGRRVWVGWSNRVIRDERGEIVGLLAVGTDRTAEREARRQLLAHQQRLRELASELALAEERERRRIAREIHDNLSQTLAFTHMRLTALTLNPLPARLSGPLSEAIELVRQAVADTRSLTFELSPPLLYEMGIEAAVEWLTETVAQRHELEYEYQDDGQHKPLPEETRTLLYQAVRELLNNTVKHSRATRVYVRVARAGDCIVIGLGDNGIGFDPAEVLAQGRRHSGFGLLNVRERMEHIGGCLEIDTAPGRGVHLTLYAPLQPMQED